MLRKNGRITAGKPGVRHEALTLAVQFLVYIVVWYDILFTS